MPADTSRAPDTADADRFEALRQALGGLLARFTADRDALITTVQECEQRLEDMAARVEARHTSGPLPAEAPHPTAPAPELDELRRALEQVQLEQRQAEARMQTTAQQAMARADDALRRIETLATVSPSTNGHSAELLAPLTADRDALRGTVRDLEERLTAIVGRLDQEVAPEPGVPKQLAEHVESSRREILSEARTLAEQATSRADGALQRVEELTAALRDREAHTASLVADFSAQRDALGSAVAGCQQALADITARLNATPAAAQVAELRQMIAHLQSEHRESTAQARQTAEIAVTHADEALSRLAALAETLPARDAHVHDTLAGLGQERDALAAAVHACEQQLAATAARLDTGASRAHLDDLKRAFERLQHEQQQAATQAQADVERTSARIEGALRRVDELAAARDETTGSLDVLHATVGRLAADVERLVTLSSEPPAPAATVTADAVSGLAQRIDHMDAELEELRQAVARARTAPALRPPAGATMPSSTVRRSTPPSPAPRVRPIRVVIALACVALGAVAIARWVLPTAPRSIVNRTTSAQAEPRGPQAPARLAGDAAGAAPAAVSEEPSAEATFAAGLEALGRGDMRTAEASFTELTKLQPDSAEAWNNLAVVLTEQDRNAAARDALHRALELRPDYERARVNLQRVEALLAAQPLPPQAGPTLEVEAHAQKPKIAAAAEPAAQSAPPAAPEAAAAAAQPASLPPSSIAALEPQGATACVFDPAHSRVCVYRRTADGIVADECYGVVTAQVRAWPQWMAASDVTSQRIRLVDETGQKRLVIVPEDDAADGDVVRLHRRDLDNLSTKVVPWRTGWVLSDGQPPTAGDADATALRATLERWRQAWERKQLDAYVGAYSASFSPQSEPDVAHWRARKRNLFEHSGAIVVQVAAPSIFLVNQGNTAFTSFAQSYRSAVTASSDLKVLRWQREGDRWTISTESVLEEHAQALGG